MGKAARNISLDVTWVYSETLKALRDGVRYIWHEGGTRSGKTYNIAPALITHIIENGLSLSVVRASFPALRATVYRDYIEVLERMNIYDARWHNKTENIISLPGGAWIEFFSVDDEQKTRGRKRDILHMNEANEISPDKRRQLWLRTTKAIIVDHNPTVDDGHWIVKLLEHERASETRRFHSTYLDNPFLSAATIREIEAMEGSDPYGWQVYGLGVRGRNPAAVFTDIDMAPFPTGQPSVYGVDFGYQDPMVVVEIARTDTAPRGTIHIRPMIHESYLTINDVIGRLQGMGASKRKEMFCDNARPDDIKALQRAGYNAQGAAKGPGSRDSGYRWLRGYKMRIHPCEAAPRTRSELGRTRHKQRGDGTYSDVVVDGDDHVADAIRYGAFEKWGKVRKSRFGARVAI